MSPSNVGTRFESLLATMRNQLSHQEHKFAYSVEEAAELLSIKRDSLYGLIKSEQLGSFKVGTRRLVAHQHLETYIESQVTQ